LKKLDHLKDIIHNYDYFIIDLWGVVHNGIQPYQGALKTIEELHNNKKKYCFLSNAPRPVNDVRKFLIEKMKIKETFLKNILTSGEAAINSIKNFTYGKFFFHLGPNRDKKIYQGLETYKTDLKKCDYILCTGLYDHEMEKLSFYEKLLENSLNKKMICTNPDLIVDKGDTQEYCAGSIAKIFEGIGGEVVYFGKPHKEIYNSILNEKDKALIIGDNLRTDIKGANLIKQDSLFILDGIHKSEIGSSSNFNGIMKKYDVKTSFTQKQLNW
tara:strand:- start:758 stop:1567 length:810 start_codon:yes stop_codon:yes gene_type:complete